MTEKIITLIFGKRGGGKSYLAAMLMQLFGRVLIFDTLHEYRNGFVFHDLGALARFWIRNSRGPFRLIYQPTDPETEFEDLAKLAWLCGDLTFLVEEIDIFCSPYRIGPAFQNVIQRGRHKNISLIGISQRPFGIHRLLTSQAKEIYIFRTNEPRDREYLRNLLGTEIEATLDGLDKYQYAKWMDGTDEIVVGKA